MLRHYWWALAIRGFVALLFGLMTFFIPGVTLAVLVLWFGAYALVDGVFELFEGVRTKYGMLIFLGILGIAAGLITFFWPAITAITLLYIIAFWAIVVGVMQIGAAFRLRKEVQGEWLWILSGLCMVVLGFLLIARPGPGALSLIRVIGWFAIVWGFMLVMLAFRLKAHVRKLVAKPA